MKKMLAFLLLLFAVLVAVCPVPVRADLDVEKYAVYARNVLGALTTVGFDHYDENYRYILLGVREESRWTSFWLIQFAGAAAPYYMEDGSRYIYYNTESDAQLWGYTDSTWSNYTRNGVNDAYYSFADTEYILYSDFDITDGNGSDNIYFPCTRIESGEATPTPVPEPTGEATPEPSGSPDGINMGDIDQVTGFFGSLAGFFQFLSEVLQVLFPFFTAQEINFLITMLVIFLGVLAYFFIRKVFI